MTGTNLNSLLSEFKRLAGNNFQLFTNRYFQARSGGEFVLPYEAILEHFGLNPKLVSGQTHIIICDAFRDLDDEKTIILMKALIECEAELAVVVTNLNSALDRACGVKGLLRLLDLGFVPVGVGTDGSNEAVPFHFERTVPFAVPAYQVNPDGQSLIINTLTSAKPKSVSVLLISSLRDMDIILEENNSLCRDRINRITLMAGVKIANGKPKLLNGLLQADIKTNGVGGASNCNFDTAASTRLYRNAQKLEIPTTTLTRVTAGEVKLPFSIFDIWATTGHPAASRLKDGQSHSFNNLRLACLEGKGGPHRVALELALDRDINWFIYKAFFRNAPKEIQEQILNLPLHESVWPIAADYGELMPYDPLALLASIEGNSLFNYHSTVVGGAVHKVVGIDAQNTGALDPLSLRMLLFIATTEVLIRTSNHAKREFLAIKRERLEAKTI